MTVRDSLTWTSPSSDPNDETFGDIVESVRIDEIDDYDAVLLGEPFDDAVIGHSGAAEGPSAIRESLAGVKTHHFDVGPVGSVADVGNVDGDFTDVSAIQEAVSEVAEKLHNAQTLPVFVGGDNSLTYANVRPLLKRGSVGVVNFDAHLDCREVQGGPTSGTPYRQLFDAGLDSYVCIGARHFETSTTYAEYADAQDVTVITAETVSRDQSRALERAQQSLTNVDHVYLSVDLDVLDAAHAPGVSAPTPGGLTTRELYRLVRLLAIRNCIAGLEVVECAPPLDEAVRTADAAARTVAHALAGSLGTLDTKDDATESETDEIDAKDGEQG